MWLAFWMLGDDVDQIGWPRSGEIDIMELVGGEADQIHATVHGPGYAGAGIVSSIMVSPDSLKDDFHTDATTVFRQ